MHSIFSLRFMEILAAIPHLLGNEKRRLWRAHFYLVNESPYCANRTNFLKPYKNV